MTDPWSGQADAGDEERPPRELERAPGGRAAAGRDGAIRRRDWLREPKSAVWMVLAAVVLIGGGRRLLWAWRARKAVNRLSEPDVTPEHLEAVAEFGRAGVWELLRIFSTTESEPLRAAAGRALARLWREDQLVAEEEKAVVRRGYSVSWNARRRYPRSLHAEIPIGATYEVPFLPDNRAYVGPDDLEWSHRILGARRAALEEFSTWKAGRNRVDFSIVPEDFPANGPHRLVLQTRVRTTGLSGAWELELPHVPFQFDFDPVLRLDSILTLPDAARDDTISRAVRLEPGAAAVDGPARLLPLGSEWVLRNPPRLVVTTPLPCDLSHSISIELDGTADRIPAGSLIVSGQGLAQRGATSAPSATRSIDIGPIGSISEGAIDRPAIRRMRVHLAADPQLAWADPEIRSVWPGQIETNWVDVEIIRK